jgi:anaerobic selenocysteine-containing dehydrogenase
LFRRLAARMGFDDECFRRSDERIAREAVDWSSPALAGVDLDYLKQHGHVRLKVGDPQTFAPHAEGNFPTPSGRTEFVSSLARAGNFVIPLFRQGSNESQGAESVDPVPIFIPPREPRGHGTRYTLNLISPKSHAFLNSSCGNMERQRRIAGDPAVTINPEDAARRGVGESQPVRVFNDRGSFTATARLSATVRPGLIVAPMGHWRKFSRGRATVNAATPTAFADLGHAPTFSDNLVEVEPV